MFPTVVDLFVSRSFEQVERLQALLSFKEVQEEQKWERGVTERNMEIGKERGNIRENGFLVGSGKKSGT